MESRNFYRDRDIWQDTDVKVRQATTFRIMLRRDMSSDHIDYTISRYRSRIHWAYDIVTAIYRTISCTNARLCSHTAAAASASDWRRLPCKPSVAPSASRSCGRPIMQRIGSLGWGLGNGSRTSGGLNYAYRKADCARLRSVKVVMISTLQCLSSVHSLIPPAAAYVYYSWLNESV